MWPDWRPRQPPSRRQAWAASAPSAQPGASVAPGTGGDSGGGGHVEEPRGDLRPSSPKPQAQLAGARGA